MAESRLPKLGDPLAKGLGVNQRLGDYEILKRLAVGGMVGRFPLCLGARAFPGNAVPRALLAPRARRAGAPRLFEYL